MEYLRTGALTLVSFGIEYTVRATTERLRKYESKRMQMYQEIKKNGWQHYRNIIKTELDKLEKKPLEETTKEFIPRVKSRGKGVLAFVNWTLDENRLDELVGSDFSLTPQQTLFFKSLIGTYYRFSDDTMDIVYDNINYSYLVALDKLNKSHESMATLAAKKLLMLFQSAIAGSGTMILKIFQQLGNQRDDSIEKYGVKVQVSDLLGGVFQNVPGMTDEELSFVKKTVAESKTGALPFMSKQIVLNASKKLGSASIAESFMSSDEKFVVKMIKPLAILFFIQEIKAMGTRVWDSIPYYVNTLSPRPDAETAKRYIRQSRQVILFLLKEFSKEFDYDMEAKNLAMGKQVYTRPNLHVHAIELNSVTTTTFPVLIVTTAHGHTLQQVFEQKLYLDPKSPTNTKKNLGKINKLMGNLVELWFGNLFWGNGFFHGDLQVGNIIIDKAFCSIYVIDFGSCGQLNTEDQCLILDSMIISNRFHSIFSNALKALVEINDKLDSAHKRSRADILKDAFAVMNQCNDCHKLHGKNKSDFDHCAASAPFGLCPSLREINSWNDANSKKGNLFVAKDMVNAIWDVCKVGARDPAELESLAQRLVHKIETEGAFYFSHIFLEIITYSTDIGQCITNQTLMFGRGINYLAGSMSKITNICNDDSVCPEFATQDIIKNNLTKFKNMDQLFLYGFGKPLCSLRSY